MRACPHIPCPCSLGGLSYPPFSTCHITSCVHDPVPPCAAAQLQGVIHPSATLRARHSLYVNDRLSISSPRAPMTLSPPAPQLGSSGYYVRARDPFPMGRVRTPLARPDLISVAAFHNVVYSLKVGGRPCLVRAAFCCIHALFTTSSARSRWVAGPPGLAQGGWVVLQAWCELRSHLLNSEQTVITLTHWSPVWCLCGFPSPPHSPLPPSPLLPCLQPIVLEQY